MKRSSLLGLFGIAIASLSMSSMGCSSTLPQPFYDLKDQPITIYRLQNYEAQPQQTGAVGTTGLPPQIQQWLTAGAQLLPQGLIPPGLIPGTQTSATPTDGPRFHNFRILGTVAVTDSKQRKEILDLFGSDSNFKQPQGQSCMYAEFGFQLGQSSTQGYVGAPPAASVPADILVSLSCDQVQMINYNWPYGAKNGMGPDTSKKIVAIVQKAFGG